MTTSPTSSAAKVAPSPELDLQAMTTPYLLLDPNKLKRNSERLQAQLQKLGVPARPHVKTLKSLPAMAHAFGADFRGPITVSTLQEAEQFAAAGYQDLLYAVGMTPDKLARIGQLRAQGVDVKVVLDNETQARALLAHNLEHEQQIQALIEIDCDGHRAGLMPQAPELVPLALLLNEACGGVMLHAGGSYAATSVAAKQQAAEQERRAAVQAVRAIRQAGVAAPIVSVGSTPTALFATDLSGVTEVRAGVYLCFDLVMAGIGVCGLDEIALSVVTTVTGHQRQKDWILIDAGWMALSRDRGTAGQALDQGYGLVCDEHGQPYSDLIVAKTSQEHGIVTTRPGANTALPDLPVGTKLRILPNHACATAAQFPGYVVGTNPRQLTDWWPRFNYW